MNTIIILLVILLLSCTIWLVTFAAKGASDPDNDFSQLEFAVAAMVLLGSAITISYFAIVYIVMEPDVLQSSQKLPDPVTQS